jgi:hypothetical protein
VKHDLLGDVREMEKLIADLLESERMNAGHTTPGARASSWARCCSR